MSRTAFVTCTTELPISAEVAFTLAQKVETFKYVVVPLFTIPHLEVPETRAPGV